MICPQFQYLTVLRHPIARIISNTLFERYPPDRVMYWARRDSNAILFFGGTPIVDNYFVRVLNGAEAYFSPLRSLTRAHLERAKEILAQFDIVMTIEDWQYTSQQLSKKLSWPAKSLTRVVNGRRDSQGKYKVASAVAKGGKTPFTEQETRELTELNALDIELFEFASRLAQNLTRNLSS